MKMFKNLLFLLIHVLNLISINCFNLLLWLILLMINSFFVFSNLLLDASFIVPSNVFGSQYNNNNIFNFSSKGYPIPHCFYWSKFTCFYFSFIIFPLIVIKFAFICVLFCLFFISFLIWNSNLKLILDLDQRLLLLRLYLVPFVSWESTKK